MTPPLSANVIHEWSLISNFLRPALFAFTPSSVRCERSLLKMWNLGRRPEQLALTSPQKYDRNYHVDTSDVGYSWKHYRLSNQTLSARNARAKSPIQSRELDRLVCCRGRQIHPSSSGSKPRKCIEFDPKKILVLCCDIGDKKLLKNVVCSARLFNFFYFLWLFVKADQPYQLPIFFSLDINSIGQISRGVFPWIKFGAAEILCIFEVRGFCALQP